MLIELHILQNFVPSNLNRDDTGAPKDCEFGGFRRGRISSQCLKRSMRMLFRDGGLLPTENLAVRTKRLGNELVSRLEASGHENAQRVVETAIGGLGLKLDNEKLTEYLLFLGQAEIDAAVAAISEHWDALASIVPPSTESTAPAERSRRAAKKDAREAIPPAVASALGTVLGGHRAADLALFGRMLADMPEKNVDAAAQVAHALSTNRVSVEFDFFTAVDDLQPDDNSGAGMLGTIEYNSACYYRYANVDVDTLIENLGGDRELAAQALRAFLHAAVHAVPTGKQNGTAAHNPPSMVFAVVRRSGHWNLANAFLKPVSPGRDGNLMEESIKRLDCHWAELTTMYGDDELVDRVVVTLGTPPLAKLGDRRVGKLGDLIDAVAAVAMPSGG